MVAAEDAAGSLPATRAGIPLAGRTGLGEDMPLAHRAEGILGVEVGRTGLGGDSRLVGGDSSPVGRGIGRGEGEPRSSLT